MNFNHCESLYWVFTQLCNDSCDHCYNLSGKNGARITEVECFAIIENMPDKIDRLILSGGEPLSEKKLLWSVLKKIQIKYGTETQVMIQTNGDLLTGVILDKLIDHGVTRFDIASIDRYHKHSGERLMELSELFDSRNVNGEDHDPLIDKNNYLTKSQSLSWGYWGATDDLWLGGNWARGRALEKNIWKRDPQHNFCKILSGGIGFLTGAVGIPQEVSIQLWRINPCCPGTFKAMGDARIEKVADVLDRVSKSAVFQKINEGDPLGMGESVGISRSFAEERNNSLQNVCLWCDEFFEKYFDMETMKSKFE
ncbi:MAG: radical SAM protein [Saprospiraceae bacterium]